MSRTTFPNDLTSNPSPSAPSGLVSIDGRTFPLRAAAIDARAEGGLAETRLRQTYVNPYKEPLEVLYTMPLPADGAVVGYKITIGDRVITGEVQPLEEAREAYQKALEEGRTAGLLEEARSDTFLQRLGSLPAGATAEIEIRILHTLAFHPGGHDDNPVWEYRFPTVVGVRYEGEPGRVHDRADLDVDRADTDGTPVRLELDLVIAAPAPGSIEPQSQSHVIRVEPCEDGAGRRVRLAKSASLDRDLVVTWNATTENVGMQLIEGPGLPGDDGRYGLVTITPPAHPTETLPRDLTILIDASGSMYGDPLDSCKEVVTALLDSLTEDDRFEILAFAESIEKLTSRPVRARAPAILRAKQRLAELEAGGATEMTNAVTTALSPLRSDAQRQVILMTDGYIGFEGEVIGEVTKKLQPGCRVHTVGVGSAPNRALTRGVARAGRGEEIFIAEQSHARDAAERLLRATVGPVLTELTISGTACKTVAPERLRDVLAGQPLVAAVELAVAGGAVEVRGRLAGSKDEWVRTISVAPAEAATSTTTQLAIGALFGREAVADCELRLSTMDCDEQQLIEQEIETLGMRHKLTTRRTSLVAIAEEPSVDPTQPRRRQRLEVELPAGVSAEGAGLVSSPFDMFQVCYSSPEVAGSALLGVASDMESLRPSPMRRRPVASIKTRVVRRDDDLIVVEFEAPHDGFTLPDDPRCFAILEDDEMFAMFIDQELSTHAGLHDVGLTLRLALRLSDDDANWPGEPITISIAGFELQIDLDPTDRV